MAEEPANLGLFEGGPLETVWRRMGLDRVLVATLRVRHLLVWAAVWIPMLAICLWHGTAVSGVAVPFLLDFEAQARFLIALPLLLIAQPFADGAFGNALESFMERGLVRPGDAARFRSFIESARRWSRGLPLTVAVIILLVLAQWYIAPARWEYPVPTWKGASTGDVLQLSAAGWWYAHVAIAVFQFILVRWVLRLLIWWVLLLRISRLDLQLMPTHPDRSGGLGILGGRIGAFSPFLVSQGVLLSGTLCNRIIYQHQPLQQMWPDAAAYGVLVLVLILGPFMTFSKPMLRAKRRAKVEYSLLASRYVNEFHGKWIGGKAPADEALLGSADIQSLADLTGSLDVISEMRFAPFGKEAIAKVLVPFALPVLPLVFTIIPADELVKSLLKIVL